MGRGRESPARAEGAPRALARRLVTAPHARAASRRAETLAAQLGLEFVDLMQVAIDPTAAQLLQEGFAHSAQVVPVRYVSPDVVQVAVADPTNLNTVDQLKLALGVNSQLAVADPVVLGTVIARTYRLSVAVSEVAPNEEALDDATVAEGALDLMNALIGRAIGQRASDVHLNPQPGAVLVRSASTECSATTSRSTSGSRTPSRRA
ncbi:MAG TPA: hypothetical protein VGQ38_06200 [Gaiellaceae bacterium]|nr:hypothetical protein [Gaiellaceae bacterium]